MLEASLEASTEALLEASLEASIEAKVFELLAARRDGATICPSEVARALRPGDDRWREAMPIVRQVAQRLADAQRLSVTRAGVPVDATRRGGPIRLGRAAPDAAPDESFPPGS